MSPWVPRRLSRSKNDSSEALVCGREHYRRDVSRITVFDCLAASRRQSSKRYHRVRRWRFEPRRYTRRSGLHRTSRSPAVYERNPSYNRYFVEPCVRSTGWQPTAPALLVYVRDGTDFEKAGAFNALYWALGHSSTHGYDLEDRVPDPPESEGESPTDTWHRAHKMLLEEFVRNPGVDVLELIQPSNLPPIPGRGWPNGGSLVCEINDGGRIDDPLVGGTVPSLTS